MKLIYAIILILTLHISTKADEKQDHWPIFEDRLEEHIIDVKKYYYTEDSLLYLINTYENKINTDYILQIFETIAKNYEKLETLSHNKHATNSKKYKELKEFHVRVAKIIHESLKVN